MLLKTFCKTYYLIRYKKPAKMIFKILGSKVAYADNQTVEIY